MTDLYYACPRCGYETDAVSECPDHDHQMWTFDRERGKAIVDVPAAKGSPAVATYRKRHDGPITALCASLRLRLNEFRHRMDRRGAR